MAIKRVFALSLMLFAFLIAVVSCNRVATPSAPSTTNTIFKAKDVTGPGCTATGDGNDFGPGGPVSILPIPNQDLVNLPPPCGNTIWVGNQPDSSGTSRSIDVRCFEVAEADKLTGTFVLTYRGLGTVTVLLNNQFTLASSGTVACTTLTLPNDLLVAGRNNLEVGSEGAGINAESFQLCGPFQLLNCYPPTNTPTETKSPTLSPTGTPPTNTPTRSCPVSINCTRTFTPAGTVTETISPTLTVSPTMTGTLTLPTNTPTNPFSTSTPTGTATPTFTITPTNTVGTPTMCPTANATGCQTCRDNALNSAQKILAERIVTKPFEKIICDVCLEDPEPDSKVLACLACVGSVVYGTVKDSQEISEAINDFGECLNDNHCHDCGQ